MIKDSLKLLEKLFQKDGGISELGSDTHELYKKPEKNKVKIKVKK